MLATSEKKKKRKILDARKWRIILLTCAKTTPTTLRLKKTASQLKYLTHFLLPCASRRPCHVLIQPKPPHLMAHHRHPYNFQEGRHQVPVGVGRRNIGVYGAGKGNGYPKYASQVKLRAFGSVLTGLPRWQPQPTTWRRWP
jgi:hypothetical protein